MLEAWRQWKMNCALLMCDKENQEHLKSLAAGWFRRYADAYIAKTNLTSASGLTHTASDVWHLLETLMTTSSLRGGKRYKDWLFDRTRCSTDPPLKVLHGGAKTLIREVVRDVIRKECFDKRIDSLDTPAYHDGELTIKDLLPGDLNPAEDVVHRELERLAANLAPGIIEDMLDREKIALFAKAAGLSLAHPGLEAVSGCRKSMLNAAYHNFLRRLSERFLKDYPDDDRESVLLLTLKTLEQVNRRLLDWGKSETALSKLLTFMGE